MKYVIWGIGAVGVSFLHKLTENGLFDSSLFYAVDYSDDAYKTFINIGGLSTHFNKIKIVKENVYDILSFLNEDDYLLDFSINVKNLDVLNYCLKNNIHYLSTADSSWNPDPEWISDHQHYSEYVKIKNTFTEKQNTSLILFGMNPGLVSSFAIKCLEEIIKNDNSVYIKTNRRKLLQLFKQKSYGLLCKKIDVTDIQEVDNDNQEFNIPYENDVCYSTWNVWAYYYETVSSAEIALGNKDLFYKYQKVYDYDVKDLYLGLLKSGYEYHETSYSPQGIVDGHISTHEEIFTIRRIFTYGKYKPNVHFFYSPSSYATKSIEQFKINPPKKLKLLTKQDIIGGGESVGIIIQGNKFSTRYYGNYLKTNELNESATIRQVSASIYAAFLYMINHPNEGMLFPEEVDHNEILALAKSYLKEYISVQIPKINMTLGR